MSAPRHSLAVIRIFCLGLLCSCAAAHSIHPNLPAETAFNEDAGRGGELLLTLHLQSGEDLLFLVDTGSSGVLLDRSFEQRLGRCFWTEKMHGAFGIQKMRLFRGQNLYLGNTQLQTGNWIWTADLRMLSSALSQSTHNRPVMGILGMSCLKHYCIQLDFTTDTMRFLDSSGIKNVDLGKALPLHTLAIGAGCFSIRENLAGVRGPRTLIDTGCNFDGWLTPKLFQRWTNQLNPSFSVETHSPNGVLDGDSYSDLYLSKGDRAFNGIGLRFLARHLVTFDFPKRTMYLKRTNDGPLMDQDSEAAIAFLSTLKSKGQLPGWAKDDKGQMFLGTSLLSETVDAIKTGDDDTYHYTIVRASKEADWKLQRVWLTDARGRIKEQYPIDKN
jgi:hypothetical protein